MVLKCFAELVAAWPGPAGLAQPLLESVGKHACLCAAAAAAVHNLACQVKRLPRCGCLCLLQSRWRHLMNCICTAESLLCVRLTNYADWPCMTGIPLKCPLPAALKAARVTGSQPHPAGW